MAHFCSLLSSISLLKRYNSCWENATTQSPGFTRLTLPSKQQKTWCQCDVVVHLFLCIYSKKSKTIKRVQAIINNLLLCQELTKTVISHLQRGESLIVMDLLKKYFALFVTTTFPNLKCNIKGISYRWRPLKAGIFLLHKNYGDTIWPK